MSEPKQNLAELGLTEDDLVISAYDTADYLDSPEMIAAYIKESLATGDPEIVDMCRDNVSRAIAKLSNQKPEAQLAVSATLA